QLVVQPEHGDKGHLGGHHQHKDDQGVEQAPPPKVELGEAKGGQGGQEDRDHRSPHRDDEAVAEGSGHTPGAEHRFVVLHRVLGKLQGAGEHRPPTGVDHVAGGAEGSDQKAKRGHDPQQHGHDHHHVDHNLRHFRLEFLPSHAYPSPFSFWRMFAYMMGMIITNKTTAMALALPVLANWNISLNMRLAITSVP